MIYESIKILHIISAAFLLTGMAASIYQWKYAQDGMVLSRKIVQYTLLILPFFLLQLLSGFTMISLKHYALSEHWLMGSLISFMIVSFSWILFICSSSRRKQIIFLSVCLFFLASMIFLMANKT